MQRTNLHIAPNDSVWDLSMIHAITHEGEFTHVATAGMLMVIKDPDSSVYGSVRWAWIAWHKAKESTCLTV